MADDAPVPGRFRISKRWTFEAAHHLPLEQHKCGRAHGHSYAVEVFVDAAMLHPPGWVDDFGELKPLGDYIAEHFDHQDLNDVLDAPPTAENIAVHLATWFRATLESGLHGRLAGIRVAETPESAAEFWLDRT